MPTCETCSTNQWDAVRFYVAVISEVRSKKVVDMRNVEQVESASDVVMRDMLSILMPAGNA
jgi:hypothetical protein